MNPTTYIQDLIYGISADELRAIATNPKALPATRSEAYDRSLILALSHMVPSKITWTNFFACIIQLPITTQFEAVRQTMWNQPCMRNTSEYTTWASSEPAWLLTKRAIIAENANPRTHYEPSYHVHT